MTMEVVGRANTLGDLAWVLANELDVLKLSWRLQGARPPVLAALVSTASALRNISRPADLTDITGAIGTLTRLANIHGLAMPRYSVGASPTNPCGLRLWRSDL